MRLFDPEAVAVYRRLLRYLYPHWRIVAASLLATIAHAAANAGPALLMDGVIARLENPDAYDGPAWLIPLLVVVVFSVRSTTNFLTVYGLNWTGRSVIRDLRRQLFDHYLAMPSSALDQTSSGVLISKLTYNTEQVAEAISN
ncbi:MAG: lipid ABC transporter permease/ATP-binding protein, partial [Gammaproteobacteria bacterium]|nr:lipid ABC transporter permease/ATP-binding protein [Gammaproteobacteria bacterium]